VKRATLHALTAARLDGRPIVLATALDTGEEHVIDPTLPPNTPLDTAAREAALKDQSSNAEIDGRGWFLNVFNPPLQMYVVGAVHIAQPLSRMAALSGFNVTVIDPRTAFATSDRFPGLTLITEWPDEALANIALDMRSAVVTLTHDPKLDDPALAAALRSPAFYIGALGSKKTHAARLGRLKAMGFDDEAMKRIHGPVGLDIEAQSPAEIAVSILAQVIARLRGAEL
jgi:xanthine dehydrogenase accessory factor